VPLAFSDCISPRRIPSKGLRAINEKKLARHLLGGFSDVPPVRISP